MKKLIIACPIVRSAAEAHAVYAGPRAEAAVTTVHQLRDAGKDDQHVAPRGHIVKLAEIPLKIDHKLWPAGQPLNETSTIELTGKHDKEIVGTSKVKVHDIKVVQ
ncbi:NirD/YgiW/YdeI family stress tolerance protein [Paraburkholderia atlantica]|uniref:NirD/YgiW/YdeI family stress tolerance protein n=1 Tax=Paraburkholderia atlantica TaxID=2654982 RepID=UPI0003744AB1|nr:NirD/YgiW/YdeI family stress tolerance protein [Paraburkholderia atlantica]